MKVRNVNSKHKYVPHFLGYVPMTTGVLTNIPSISMICSKRVNKVITQVKQTLTLQEPKVQGQGKNFPNPYPM